MTSFTDQLLDLAIRIQQVPAPTFQESARGEFVRSLFVDEGLQDISMDEVGNVFARLPGNDSSKPIVVSAHLDTVFPPATDLAVKRDAERIHAPGIGDNSLGVAALFGLIWSLRARSEKLKSDLWVVANVGEEGLGDLRGMKAVVDHFGVAPQLYLVLEGMAFGSIYHQAIGVRRYKIICRTTGGHSWSDYGLPSAIHELARLVIQIAELPLPKTPRTTLNVGKIAGGTTVNTIAAEAWLELDLRSEDPAALKELIGGVERLVQNAERVGVKFELEQIGDRPAGGIPAEHPFVKLAEVCVREQGAAPHLTGGSTDANVPLSRGYPSIVLGVTTGGSAHTVHEYINTEPVEKGMASIVDFVTRVVDWNLLEEG